MSSTIKPFNAAYYNTKRIKKLSTVVCPPYDVISPKELQALRRKSSYNYSHILLTKNNNYNAVGKRFKQWFKDQILVDDGKDCVYLYEQTFKSEGKTHKRFGYLCLLRMDRKKGVCPHEYTLKAPKVDRKKIISEMKANLSPIFAIVPKKLKAFHDVYKEYNRQKPFFKFNDILGITNKVWRIEDKKDITRLRKAAENANMVIADGHHRFEVSYDYFKRNKGKFKDLNYLMAFIADEQKGLLILPTHRIVDTKNFSLNGLSKYFTIQKVSQKALEKKLKSVKNFAFGVYNKKTLYYLQLKDASILDKVGVESVYRKLDTYVLHKVVLPQFSYTGGIKYTHTINEAKELAGAKGTAFIVKSASLENVFSIANKGYRLPQKSTYFYPKLLSGVVVRRFSK